MKLHAWPMAPAEIAMEIARDGIIVLQSDELCDSLLARPFSAAAELLGAAPLHYDVVAVRPVDGQASIVESNRDGRLHTDSYPMMSPDLVVMSCHQQSVSGGESVFVDSWQVLDAIRCEDPSLYEKLFTVCRAFRFPAYRVYAPTFGFNQGAFVFHHATFPDEGDEVGRHFQHWVERARKLAFRLEPGQVYLIDNHRMLHGRTRFTGARHLQRLQLWNEERSPIPERFFDAASAALEWRDHAASHHSDDVRRRLGLSRVPQGRFAELPCRDHDALLDRALQTLPPPPAGLLDRITCG